MQTFANQRTKSNHTALGLASGVINQQIRNILRAGVQPKLKIGAINDSAEIEADRVADQVMHMPSRMHEQPAISVSSNSDQARRQCTDCNKDDEVKRKTAPQIRMKSSGGQGGEALASAEASTAINNLGTGAPLPASERAFFEPRFGRDLSGVRIHTGGAADRASKTIHARAFTLGNNITFANGEYTPGTPTGRSLLAHELTHTVQQNKADNTKIQRYGDPTQIPESFACPVREESTSGMEISRLYFGQGSSTLSAVEANKIDSLAASVHSMATAVNFEIDGFASTEGHDSENWTLSCERAQAVFREMETPSNGTPGIPVANMTVLANGETSEFGSDYPANRIATITTDTFLQSPIVPPTPQPVTPTGDPYPDCAPNPLGSHLPPVGRGHPRLGAGMTMLPCSLTESQILSSPDWCVDFRSHSGERCYRRIPATSCGPSDQFCFTSADCCHSSPDSVSPVSRAWSSGRGGQCIPDLECTARHWIEDVH